MMSLNGPRPAVPSTLPFSGATTDRNAATAVESSRVSGWITNQEASGPFDSLIILNSQDFKSDFFDSRLEGPNHCREPPVVSRLPSFTAGEFTVTTCSA